MKTVPIRVLHICQRDDPTSGGATRVAVELVKRLNLMGHDAHILFVYGPEGIFKEQLGEKAHHLGLESSRDFRRMGTLRTFIRELAPQIIHHHDGLLWVYGLTAITSAPKVIHGHCLPRKTEECRRATLTRFLQRLTAQKMICTSETMRSVMRVEASWPDDKTYVVANGVDQEHFRPPTESQRLAVRERFGLPKDARVAGFVGRLDCDTKGADDFLRSLATLEASIWGLLAGGGPDEAKLKAMAQELGIANRVVFTGPLADPLAAYHAMDAFALTSRFELFGLVVVEALACGLPVVAFTCQGGVGDILADGIGTMVDTRTPEALAQVLARVLDGPRPPRPNLSPYDWTTGARLLSELYGTLLMSRTTASVRHSPTPPDPPPLRKAVRGAEE
ncbi:MAG: glycosyltransferase [Sumerlaeia bacterium]